MLAFLFLHAPIGFTSVFGTSAKVFLIWKSFFPLLFLSSFEYVDVSFTVLFEENREMDLDT